MTPSTVRSLKQIAEAATPGPWDDYYETGIQPCVMAYDENDKGLRSIRAFIADTQFANDRAFIAAANPEAVLGLIARIEKLEAALQFYADEANWYLQKDVVTGSEVRRSIILDDTESYSFQESPASPNILCVTAGKIAREALKEETP